MTLNPIESVKWPKLRALVEQYPSLPPPGKRDAEVVRYERSGRDAENVTKLLKRALLSVDVVNIRITDAV